MRDGSTEKLSPPSIDEWSEFVKNETAKLVVVVGDNAGEEFELKRQSAIMGRGPAVDWIVNDSAVSRQHAAIEFCGAGFRVRDLGSTNGILVDGKRVQSAQLSNGDRFRIGEREFQFVTEQIEPATEVFELPAEV